MNARDENAVISTLASLIARHESKPAVIAFDSTALLSSGLRNTGRKNRLLLDEVNDLLSSASVCEELGAVFTVCEYECDLWYLIRADKAASDTPRYFGRPTVDEQ